VALKLVALNLFMIIFFLRLGIAGKAFKSKPLPNLFGQTDFASSWAGKGLSGFADFGLQSSASDFAYTSQEKYLKRDAVDHLGIFAFGGAGGFVSGASTNWVNGIPQDYQALSKLGITLGAYGTSYIGVGWAKDGFKGIKSSDFWPKAAINLYKIGLPYAK
jgi:hypothetical protein